MRFEPRVEFAVADALDPSPRREDQAVLVVADRRERPIARAGGLELRDDPRRDPRASHARKHEAEGGLQPRDRRHEREQLRRKHASRQGHPPRDDDDRRGEQHRDRREHHLEVGEPPQARIRCVLRDADPARSPRDESERRRCKHHDDAETSPEPEADPRERRPRLAPAARRRDEPPRREERDRGIHRKRVVRQLRRGDLEGEPARQEPCDEEELRASADAAMPPGVEAPRDPRARAWRRIASKRLREAPNQAKSRQQRPRPEERHEQHEVVSRRTGMPFGRLARAADGLFEDAQPRALPSPVPAPRAAPTATRPASARRRPRSAAVSRSKPTRGPTRRARTRRRRRPPASPDP